MVEQLLIINGGSSSIKYALYESPALRRVMKGKVERIGLPGSAADHEEAIQSVIEAIEKETAGGVPNDKSLGPRLTAIGHRIVHGGLKYGASERISDEVIHELRRLVPLDPEHLPSEIAIAEALAKRYPDVPQVACFDTAFGRAMPRVAKIVAIPRRYEAMGVQRYGFHGLSYTYLMEEIARLDGVEKARGRIVLAHLGNGASMAAVREGKCVETTMGLTPVSGLVMSTRSGDIDPGLAGFLHRSEGMSLREFHEMIHERSGLLGISGTSPDMRDLLARRDTDVRAAEAVEVFCYQVRKWIGALAAVLGGTDMLVFSGGIGEKSPQVRSEICRGLEFLGMRVDAKANETNALLISEEKKSIPIRVIQTDEEQVIARETYRLIRSS